MYRQDSFFDLTTWGQIGLACLSITLALVVFFAARRILKNQSVWIRVVGALVLFWLFIWVSPQIYYTYYLTIFPDLPLQWVIWPPESPTVAFQYLLFQGPHNLSAHSQGILGWSLILAPFIRIPMSR